MHKLKYIAFYDLPDSQFKRVYSPAATSKIDYIVSALNRINCEVSLVSPSWFDFSNKKISFKKSQKQFINDKTNLILAPSFGGNNKVAIYSKIILSLTWLFFYLLFTTKKDEKIIVYHSIWISFPILLAQKIKKFKILLEVEEIYQDVMTLHPFFDKWENKILSKADCFLFSTDLLKVKLNIAKPNVVIYGSYFTQNKKNSPPSDDKIHLLYAGIIDKDKRGAINALECAKYLSENYVLHIIGFGELDLFLPMIEKHNKTSSCKAYYHGNKGGDDYIAFCQSCHVGLSTQKMNGDYLQSSFPSKILSYLGMGLRVVSSNVECVKVSKVNNLINYYEDDTPESIAEAIQRVNVSDSYNSLELIKKLDTEFMEDLKNLLK